MFDKIKSRCLAVVLLIAAVSYGFKTNHPYLYLTQKDLDNLKAHVESGVDDYITRTYAKMKAYADATINDSPTYSSSLDAWPEYYAGLTDTEKATAWAICYHVEDDINYAQKAKNFVINIAADPNSTKNVLSDCSHSINTLIMYDLTANSDLYTPAETAQIQSFITRCVAYSHYFLNGILPTKDTNYQNMDFWQVGAACVAAIMTGDENVITTKAYYPFTELVDDLRSDGHFYDFDWRGDAGLDYNCFSLDPLTIAARAAQNDGRDWWGYNGHGRSLKLAIDFLASPAAVKPSSWWCPTVYGNLDPQVGYKGSGGVQNHGDYAKTLPQRTLSDKRYLIQVAMADTYKDSWKTVLLNTDGGKNVREEIFSYHTQLWMPNFLDVPDYTSTNKAAEKTAASGASLQVSPNPFNPTTVIKIRNPQSAIALNVFNCNGRLIASDVSPLKTDYTYTWDASRHPSGTYLVRATVGNKTLSKLIPLIK